MKVMKKFTAIALSLAMMLVTSISVFAAAGTYTITAPANGHQYEIYQIFTGDLSNDVLSNVKWGQNGTGTEGEDVSDTILQELANVAGDTDAEKLAVITKYANLKCSSSYSNKWKYIRSSCRLLFD